MKAYTSPSERRGMNAHFCCLWKAIGNKETIDRGAVWRDGTYLHWTMCSNAKELTHSLLTWIDVKYILLSGMGRSECKNNFMWTLLPDTLILSFSQEWWHIAVTTGLERLNSEDCCEFKSSLDYTVSSRSACTTEWNLVSKNKAK